MANGKKKMTTAQLKKADHARYLARKAKKQKDHATDKRVAKRAKIKRSVMNAVTRGRPPTKSLENVSQHAYVVRLLKSYISNTEAKLVARGQALVTEAVANAGGKFKISIDAGMDDQYRMLSRCIMLATEVLAMEQGTDKPAEPVAPKTVAKKESAQAQIERLQKQLVASAEKLAAEQAAMDAENPVKKVDAKPAKKKVAKKAKVGA